jgi:anti-sigma-K factor RskA
MTDHDRMSDARECKGDAAAYALGALEPAEAEVFRRHLVDCVVCRDELAAFRGAVDALPLAAPQHELPSGLRNRVLGAVRAEPRSGAAPVTRRRPRALIDALPRRALAAAALVVALAIGAAGGAIVASRSSTSVRTVAASVGRAAVRITGSHGELLVLSLPSPPPGQIYQIWLLRSGAHAPSPTHALFSVTHAGTADIGLPGNLTGYVEVLVTLEPAGGTLVPTTTPVIEASLT